MKLFKIINNLTHTNLCEMADVVGVTYDPPKTAEEVTKLRAKLTHILTTRGVKDHAKVIEAHPVEQEKPPKYLFEIKESSCFGRLFDARDPYCNGKCGFAQECGETLERLALQVSQGQPVLARSKKGKSIMALKKPAKTEEKIEKKAKKTEEAPTKKGVKIAAKPAKVEEEAPVKQKKVVEEAPAEAPKKKKAKVVEEAPAEEKKGKKTGTAKAEKKLVKKAITPFGDGRFIKVLVEKNPLQKKDTAYDLAGALIVMAKTATKSRLTQEQFYKAIEQFFVLPEDEAKAVEQIKEVAEELKSKAVAKVILLKGE